MSKKRNCRYTPEESVIHEKAVKLRKMTDKQLVNAFNSASDVHLNDKVKKSEEDTTKLQKLLNGLKNGECKGIKNGLALRIEEYARESGLIS